MNDGLKQVSDYIKSISSKADRALKRYIPPEESSENIRDVIDTETPLKAHFNTPEGASTVLMSFNVGPRSGIIGCCADCICGNTESFSSDVLVDGDLYLAYDYITNSTNVYIDDIRAVRGVNYTESGSNRISLLTPGTVIVISYTYNVGNCTSEEFPCGFVNWPGATAFVGNEIVFSDRFDRVQGPIPSGGCGAWWQNEAATIPSSSIFISRYISDFDGEDTFAADIDGAWASLGGKLYNCGSNIECLAAIDLSRLPLISGASFTLSFNGGEGSDSFDATMRLATSGLTLSGPYRVYTADNGISTNFGYGIARSSISPAPAYTGKIFIRFVQIRGFGWQVKIWNQDEPEPSSWALTLTEGDITLTTGQISAELIFPTMDRLYADVSSMQAIEVWADASAGTYDAGGNDNWSFVHQYPDPNDGFTRIYVNPPGTTITQQGFTNSIDDVPSCQYQINFPIFHAGPGRALDSHQQIRGFDITDGHPPTVRITGQIRVNYSGNGSPNSPNVHPIFFEVYEEGTPPTAFSGDFFDGREISSITPDPGAPNGPRVWTDFSIDVPTADGKLRWGIRFALTNEGTAGEMPYDTNFTGNNFSISSGMRNIKIEGLSNIQCTAPDICPDTQGSDTRGFVTELEGG